MSKNQDRKFRKYAPTIYFEKMRVLPKHGLRQVIFQNIVSGKCAPLDEFLDYLKSQGDMERYEMTERIIAEVKAKLCAA